MSLPLIVPDWPAPPTVRALVSTRAGGVSHPPYESLNLATHVGDATQAVSENRARLRKLLPSEPLWLEQVHGCTVAVTETGGGVPCADASVARTPGRVCAVLTADCLPVLFCNEAGTVVAAAHAGWRGLAAGVLEATLARMEVPPREVIAWLGPAIGPASFEVGGEVRDAFVGDDAGAAAAFRPGDRAGKWMADLFQLARLRLTRAGVSAVHGGGICTHADSARFYSYRRDGVTGRFASLVWLAP
ncbi:MAG: peptidoglycan editing factor PgeF [Thauera phenolivorans]|uniref:Purine nucleoside phosphorylase n=1 Tax=Thauera phenolivorans TaxID=1792543 RepID=A0A7X7LVF9_9RHOO|nr:peptidoglycan editing factor PgeF [Thauera phenolivorans]NLF54060.1 peptidoglycan editing factor PgeF [Thauera phenolivorans]